MNDPSPNAIELFTDAENEELAKLNAEKERLTARLAEVELERETLAAEMQVFRARYIRRLGALEAALLRLEELLFAAQYEAGDQQAAERAKEAGERAEQAEREVADMDESHGRERFEPTEELKSFYRQVAKALHPDLAVDDQERDVRTSLMAEFNNAYRAEDRNEMERIWRTWLAGQKQVDGPSLEEQIERARSQVEHLSGRLRECSEAVGALRGLPIFELMLRVRRAEEEGAEDAFAEIEKELKEQIALMEQRLNKVLSEA